MSIIFKQTIFLILLGISFKSFASNQVLHQLDWMKGRWVGGYNGSNMESYYTTSEGGLILGQTKIAGHKGIEFYEFEKFEEQDGDILLTPMPFGKLGVTFTATLVTNKKVIFENPEHDFPNKIIYMLERENRMIARIEGIQNGQYISEEFVYSLKN
ncbi:MAG: hypothetical protein KDD40_06885 [Bdellovibrionales bacterium]|nr:hypothetical protein [Bdellovibrionales bacterium]